MEGNLTLAFIVRRHSKLTRHERDQSFLVPVRKKISSRSRRKKVLGFGPGSFRNKFWVRVPVKNILVTVSVQKNILVLVLFRKNFGSGSAGTGTTLLISKTNICVNKLLPKGARIFVRRCFLKQHNI